MLPKVPQVGSMKPDLWERIEKLYHAALALEPDRRSAFVAEAASGDPVLQAEVESLIQSREQRGNFLDAPPVPPERLQELNDLLQSQEESEGPIESSLLQAGKTAARDSSTSERSSSLRGEKIAHYQIIRKIGKGGMGEVLLARDLKLDRDVAIKILPEEFAQDPERVARFHREAKVLASLNHPNIATIYGRDESQGTNFLVLEFIEGDTLAQRIDNGALPLNEVLEICRQIAAGLDAAHRKSIVHRDLKPANIKITPEAKVKLLDFGLAKPFYRETDIAGGTDPQKRRGPIRGTVAYMSPEQARGDFVDARSDIWSFGCVLYEMLTGRKAFAGGNSAVTVQAILEREPDWGLLPRTTPASLKRLLQECLEKDPQRRPQSAKNIGQIFEGIQSGRKRRYRTWAAAVLSATVLAGLVLLGVMLIPKTGNLRVLETQHVTIGSALELDPALSPDGKWVAYAGGTMEHMEIYVRQIPNGETRNLTSGLGYSNNRWPRWSPDGRFLAFVTEELPTLGWDHRNGRSIQIIPSTGGKPQFAAEAGMLGHAWSPDGKKLVYVLDDTIRIYSLDTRVSHKIGELVDAHTPSWSPDGKWIAVAAGNWEAMFEPSLLGNVAGSRIVLFDAVTGRRQNLTDALTGNTSPAWMPDSRSILFLSNREGSRDVFELRLSGSGETEGDPVRITAGLDALSIDVSADGHWLAYAKLVLKGNLASLPIPRSETVSSVTAHHLTEGIQNIEGFDVTRNGKWIVYDSNRSGNQQIFKMPLAGGPEQQLTHNAQDNFSPSWSPNGQYIAFHSFQNGNRDIFVMAADGTGLQQVTSDPAQERYPRWSSDGLSIFFFSDKSGNQDIYRVSRENGKWGIPTRLTFSEAGATFPSCSPDGKAIAYFDSIKGLSLVSPDGKNPRLLVARQMGMYPLYSDWSGDSKTVYFRAEDDRKRYNLWSVPARGGVPELLVRFNNPSRYEFSANDESFFFTIPERESDIWMLRLVR
jgi:Tol biopolymer transport system component